MLIVAQMPLHGLADEVSDDTAHNAGGHGKTERNHSDTPFPLPDWGIAGNVYSIPQDSGKRKEASLRPCGMCDRMERELYFTKKS